MKRLSIIIVSLFCILLLSSCTENKETETVIKEKTVKTIILKEENREKSLKYTGFLSPRISLTNMNSSAQNQTMQAQNMQNPSMQNSNPESLKNLVIKISVSSEDKNKIEVDDKAYYFENDEKIESKVLNISDIPDPYTSTYEVDLEFKNEDDEDTEYDKNSKDDENDDKDSQKLNIGDFVEANIITGEEKGIWISVNNILSDGNDFVYVVKDNRAYIKNIKILSYSEDKALVEGLEKGDELIVSGYSSLSDGYKVKVLKEDEKED